MGTQRIGKRAEFLILEVELRTRLLDNARDRRVVHVADAGEEVVFHLIIQASEQPSQNAAARGEVRRGLQLVDRPLRFNMRGVGDV